MIVGLEGVMMTRYEVVSSTYLTFSFLGLALLTILTFSIPSSSSTTALQSQFFGLFFIAICVSGMLAGIYPSKCLGNSSKSGDAPPRKTGFENEADTNMVFKGHHPSCGSFSSHIVHFKGRSYCAGCTGLVFGALFSASGTALFLLSGVKVGGDVTAIFLLGFVGVTLGLLQYNLRVDRAMLHLLLNVAFVVGAFLIFLAVMGKGSTLLGSYSMGLTVYWIVARILLSRTGHKRICSHCETRPCSYQF
jgi:hypothetical protein